MPLYVVKVGVPIDTQATIQGRILHQVEAPSAREARQLVEYSLAPPNRTDKKEPKPKRKLIVREVVTMEIG